MNMSPSDQEIDLGQLFNKIRSFFTSILDRFFDLLLFIKRNIIIVLVLIVVGVSLGIYLDAINKSYKHNLIVKPNFDSSSYLYAKVELLNAKRKERDTLFLKATGIKDVKNFNNIEIEPIIDVYKFIENNPQNFDLIKLMAEDGNLQDIIKEDVTSKNYPFHLITFSTRGTTTREKTVTSILNFLNDSEYYDKIKAQYIENIKTELAANEATIAQINGLLNAFSITSSINQKSDKLVYYNENNQLNDIIESKEKLIQKLGYKRISLINSDVTIKEVGTILNIQNIKGTNGKMKFVLPLVFVFLFLILSIFKRFYNAQILKRNIA